MSTHNTAKLPRQLVQELGLQDVPAYNIRGKRAGPGIRKERRKAARVQKKPRNVARAISHTVGKQSHSLKVAESSKEGEQTSVQAVTKSVKPVKSILKKSKSFPQIDHSEEVKSDSRLARGVRDRLAADDAKIQALEKALGIKGKKLPKSFEDDGLDALLDGLNGSEDKDPGSPKRKRIEEDKWLQTKRRKALGNNKVVVDEEELYLARSSDQETPSDTSGQPMSDDDDSSQNSFESFATSSTSKLSEGLISKRVRENPYVAPNASQSTLSTVKYVPPSKRSLPSSAREDLQRLRRQIQGLVNRLSESNLLYILKDIEKQYREYARQDVSDTLLNLLMALLSDPAILQDTFIILHAGFIAAVYKVIGMEFGAQMVQRIVADFDSMYPAEHNGDESGKKLTNLVSLLSQLYNFQVIGSSLMYDYIESFLEELSEINTELLLKIIRNSGPQLRQDNPSSLKNILLQLHNAVARANPGKLSVRTQFMIETMNDLKNNRMKKGVATSEIMSQHIIHMKKALGSLNTGITKASEPLGFRLQDIRNSDKRGEWWRVGASYRGQTGNKQGIKEESNELPVASKPSTGDDEFDGSTLLLELAREQRMNTDVRRSIFITLLSDADPGETCLRLLKLSTKKQLEIPKVLMHCACMEKTHNPYYTEVAKRLCSARKLKTAFQFSLWDAFKKMEEGKEDSSSEGDDENQDEMDTRDVVSLAKLFGTLVSEGTLGLVILKTLNPAYLRPKTRVFLEVFLIRVLTHSQRESPSRREEKPIMNIFLNLRDTPNLAKGLQYFLHKVVARTDIAGNEQDTKTVRWASKVAIAALTAVSVANE